MGWRPPVGPANTGAHARGKALGFSSSLPSEGISLSEYQLHLHTLVFLPSTLWQRSSTLPLAALRVLEALLLYLGALGVSNQRNSGHRCGDLCCDAQLRQVPEDNAALF